MKGVYNRSLVHAAATGAAHYWQGLVNERRERWVEATSARRRGFFDRRPVGRQAAQELFEQSSWYVDGGGDAGAYWRENEMVGVAERLARLSDHAGPRRLILDEYEMECLRPILPKRA